MAVQSTGGRSVPLFVLIIFVALFLISTTGLVVLFVYQEDIRQQAAQKQTQFDTYLGAGMTGRLDPYRAMGSASTPRKSATAALLDDRDQLAVLLTGNQEATLREAHQRFESMLSSLSSTTPAADELKQMAQSDLLGAFEQMVQLYRNQAIQMAGLQQLFVETQQDRDIITASYKDLEEKFNERTEQFMRQLADLERLTESVQQEFNDQLRSIQTQVSSDLQEKMATMQMGNKERIDELQEIVRRNLTYLIASTRELAPASVRAAASVTIEQLTQKVDGQVLNRAGRTLYINMGVNQNVYPGMRFCAVSGVHRGQVNPPVKGVLEVVQVGDHTAECQLILTTPGETVTQGDLLVNKVFDRDLKLNFFVLGDFDVTGNGRIDPDGEQRVAEIVRLSGGQISDRVSPAVHFVVLGASPEEPQRPSTAAGDTEYQRQLQRYRDYTDLRDQAQALNIPTIAPEAFLRYTGFAPSYE